MRPTQTLTGIKARDKILKGVNAIYHPVAMTLGPEGRNALLYRVWGRGPRITNDGATVANVIQPKDVFERLAAEAFREACLKTNERVGDGTTTTTVIAGKLYNDIHHLIISNTSRLTGGGKIGVRAMRKNILQSAERVKEKIKARAVKVETRETLEKIAAISTGDEKLGKLVSAMAWKVGVDGFIVVTEGYKTEIETEEMEGMRFHAKVPAKGFLNNPGRFEMIAKDCAVIITNYALIDPNQFADAINPILKATNNNLIIIAPEFSQAILEDMYRSMFAVAQDGSTVRKPGINIFPVIVPQLRTEVMEDIAVFCGAHLIDKNKGRSWASVKPADAGFLEKLIVKDVEAKEDAVALGGKGTRVVEKTDISEVEEKRIRKNKAGEDEEYTTKEKISTKRETTELAEYIAKLKGQLEETRTETFKNLIRQRIGGMSSAVGIIRVGDTTRASSLYNKLKIEDAVNACKAALRMGYVKGGGLCLKEIADEMPDDDMLKPVLAEPYKIIQDSFDEPLEIDDNVIDPAEVPYYSVEHAVGVVANLITCDITIPEWEDPINGEGEFAIAKAILNMVATQKIQYGQIKANDEETWKDAMGGLTTQEYMDENENK